MVGLDVEQAWVNAVADDYFWPHTARWNSPASWATTALGEIAQISALTPASVPAGAGDTIVTIAGSGFTAGATAQLNGAALATSVISGTELRATVPAAQLRLAGVLTVTAANPGLAAAPSAGLPLSVTNPLPRIAQASLAGRTLTIAGSDFAPGAMAQLNGDDYPTTGGGALIRVSVAADIAAGLTVSVFNPGPGGGVSNVVTLGASPGPGGNRLYLPLLPRR